MELEATIDDPAPESTCSRCGHAVGHRYAMREEQRCLRCALLYPPMLRRSFLTALVVGTLLTLINQWGALAHGDVAARLYWTVPLTYSVPFFVATWGALGNARRRS